MTAGRRLLVVLILGSLSAFGPMSIDLYLPALPGLAKGFGVGESSVQLTLTACLAGLALGQLLSGPCSDAFGRRRPLLIGLALYAIASIGCALAPSAAVLTGMRLLQGLAGAAGLVIARAVVRDMFDGLELARFLSLLMLVSGIAPIVAPLIGSQLLRVFPWQGLFGLLAGYGLVLLVASTLWLPESLAPEARNRGGLRSTLGVMGGLLADRRFVGYALTSGLIFAAMFSYIAGSPFVLQRDYGFSPALFGLAFGVNALGIAVFGQLNRVLLKHHSPRRMLLCGLLIALVGGLGLLVAVVAGLGLPAVLPSLFAVVASVGLVTPNATALALGGLPGQAGSASALLGVLQFLLGAIAAPLVGASGTGGALSMAALMCGLTILGLLCYLVLTRDRVGPASG